MNYMPRLEIDLSAIRQNAATVSSLAAEFGIAVWGVTKAVGGDPWVARAMLSGGVEGLADARLTNLIGLRRQGFSPLVQIRSPGISDAAEVVRWVDISFNSQPEVLEELSRSALRQGKQHRVLIMVDVGDIREGIMPSSVFELADALKKLNGIDVIGVGTNMGCFGGILPAQKNLNILLETGQTLARELRKEFEIFSGGGSNVFSLLCQGELPAWVNQLRVGESILLGRDLLTGKLIPGCRDDAFTLVGEVIEVQEKPSVPFGEVSRDAFGEQPEFDDRGIRSRVLLALGKQDMVISGIRPLEQGSEVLGASSDHLILDVTDSGRQIQVGNGISISLDYAGLMSAATSPFIQKWYKNGGQG